MRCNSTDRVRENAGLDQNAASRASASVLSSAAVYREELGYVRALLGRFGVPRRDREDLAHDVFVVVHRRQHEFDNTRAVRPWLAGIALRVAVAYKRRMARSDIPGDLTELAAPLDVERALVDRSVQRAAIQRLARLPVERQRVFVLYELEGYSAPEIADAIQAPLNTVYSRLRLARKQLAHPANRRLRPS